MRLAVVAAAVAVVTAAVLQAPTDRPTVKLAATAAAEAAAATAAGEEGEAPAALAAKDSNGNSSSPCREGKRELECAQQVCNGNRSI